MARGSIVKRVGRTGDPSYLVRVEIGTDPATGKRVQAAETFRTRKEAERR